MITLTSCFPNLLEAGETKCRQTNVSNKKLQLYLSVNAGVAMIIRTVLQCKYVKDWVAVCIQMGAPFDSLRGTCQGRWGHYAPYEDGTAART